MATGDAALGRLSGLYIGFGEFGINLGLTILETCRDYRLNVERFVKHVQVLDFYPGTHFLERRRRRGFEPVVEGAKGSTINAEAARLSKCLTYRQLAELPSIASGVGSYWPLSAYYTRRNFSRIYVDLREGLEKEAGRKITDFNIFIYAASSGGGTGNGSAPEFARQFIRKLDEEENLRAPHVLHMGVTVLPSEEKEPRIGLAESNTLTFLGRFSNIVKTIFIGDNQYILTNEKVSPEEALRRLNELLAWSILGLFFMNYVYTDRYEAADYVAFFSTEGRSTWVVPAFCSFEEDKLNALNKIWKVEALAKSIVYKLQDSLAAGINTKYEARKLLVILALPEAISKREDFDSELRKALSDEFNVSKKNIHVAYAHVDFGGLAYAFAYIVDPFIQRIKNIYDINADLLKDSSGRRRQLESLVSRMRRAMPSASESYRIEDIEYIKEDIEWIENALKKFDKIFRSYLGNWGIVPDEIGQNPHGIFPLLNLLPKFGEPIVKPQEPINIKLEVIYLEEKEPDNLTDTTVLLNSGHDFDVENYTLIEYRDRTIEELLEIINTIFKKEGFSNRPLLCLKLGGYYMPLTYDVLRLNVDELSYIPGLTISLVYFSTKKEHAKK